MNNLEILYKELLERREFLEKEILEYENSKEIIYRSELQGKARENILTMVRVQEMLLKEKTDKIATFSNTDFRDGPMESQQEYFGKK